MKPWRVCFAVPGSFLYLPFFRRLFPGLARLGKTRLKSQDSFRLTHILIEAYNNAVVHAHDRKPSRWVEIALTFGARNVSLEIGDCGKGWRHPNGKMPGVYQTHGRGLALIRAFGGKLKRCRTKSGHRVHIDFKKTL